MLAVLAALLIVTPVGPIEQHRAIDLPTSVAPTRCLMFCIDGFECRYGPCRPRVVNLGVWDPIPHNYNWPPNNFPKPPDPAPDNSTFSKPGEPEAP